MAAAQSGAPTQDQITISRNGRERNLSVRVTSEQSGDSDRGYVVTLDDITELGDRPAYVGMGGCGATDRA